MNDGEKNTIIMNKKRSFLPDAVGLEGLYDRSYFFKNAKVDISNL
jgi:hypothetical protein